MGDPLFLESDMNGAEDALDGERQRVLAILKRHGRAASSFQLLEQDYTYWFLSHDDHNESVVAYVSTRRFMVVAGGPVGPVERLKDTLETFADFCRSQDRHVLVVGLEPWQIEGISPDVKRFEVFKIGEQPEWDTEHYHVQGPDKKSLRAQINRAKNKGVSVRRVDGDELAQSPGSLRLAIDHILNRWLRSRRLAVLHFMVNLEPFTLREYRRYYVAVHNETPVGFLAAIPVFQRNGWFFEDVIRVPEAPNGTSELLIHHAIEDARENQENFVTLGLSPLTGIESGPGDHRMLRWGLRQSARRLSGLYGFQGLRAFKARMGPDAWVSQYALRSASASNMGTAWALFDVFSRGSAWSFLYDSFRRLLNRVNPRVWAMLLVVQLAALLPWTILLAMADGRRWFGDQSIQAAWVTFDALLFVALAGLAILLWRNHRASRRMSMFLAGATLTDLILSTTQAVKLHGHLSGWAVLFVTLGVLGPAVATFFLWCIAIGTPPVERS